jgi:hypothetical protein
MQVAGGTEVALLTIPYGNQMQGGLLECYLLKYSNSKLFRIR